MSGELPAPLVPAHIDLRGFEWMPLYGHRLFGSGLNTRATDSEFRAALALWWSAWNEVPAASLPNDDVDLCKAADLHRDLDKWHAVKKRAMHNFVLCSDGRWYHSVLAPLAIQAWERRESDRLKKQRWREKQKTGTKHDVPGTSPGPASGTDASAGNERANDAETGTAFARDVDTPPMSTSPATAKDVFYPLRGEERRGEERSSTSTSTSKPLRSSEVATHPARVNGAHSELPTSDFRIDQNLQPASMPSNLQRETWTAWLKHRMEKRKPVTPTEASLTLAKLAKVQDAERTVTRTIEQGKTHIEPDRELRSDEDPQRGKGAWWRTPAGIDRKGSELGMRARGGETYEQFADRIKQQLAKGTH